LCEIRYAEVTIEDLVGNNRLWIYSDCFNGDIKVSCCFTIGIWYLCYGWNRRVVSLYMASASARTSSNNLLMYAWAGLARIMSSLAHRSRRINRAECSGQLFVWCPKAQQLVHCIGRGRYLFTLYRKQYKTRMYSGRGSVKDIAVVS
jgi:hypothetical protein